MLVLYLFTCNPPLQSQKQKSDAMCELKTAHDWQAEKEVCITWKFVDVQPSLAPSLVSQNQDSKMRIQK